MTGKSGPANRRFRFVRLEERIAPSGFGFRGLYHFRQGSADGGEGSSPVVTTLTVRNNPGNQSSWTFVGGTLTGSSTTPSSESSNVVTAVIPAGTSYTYQGGWFTVSYHVSPHAATGDGGM